MSSPLTAAEAACWVAHLCAVEAQALDQSRVESDRELADERMRLARELHDHARKLDASDDLWRRSISKWNGGGDRLYWSKPTRRRGTKPASLAQLMSDAANSLKEP
jgi:uncharacterized iron-regulated protein